MDVATFLQSTITTPSGYLCIALRSPNVTWHEQYVKYPDEIDKAMQIAYDSRDEFDVYFTSYLFNTPDSSSKENVLPSCTIQADLDSADIRNLPLKPGTLVKTSPGRYQAYWYIDPARTTLGEEDAKLDLPHHNGIGIDLELHELLSRRLTYAIHDADRSGWSLGHKVRVADTFNHKYIEGMHLVEVVDHDPRRYTVGELELLPDVDSITLNRFDSEFITNPPTDPKLHPLGPNELLVQIRSKIPLQVYAGYNQQATDRSLALWALMCGCFRAGLDRNDVYWLALHSANNKFARLHYHAERELAKDVLRAEHEVFTIQSDPRGVVADLRKSTLDGPDKKRAVMGFVYGHMKEEGDFIKTATSESWYVPRDTGRPVFMSQRNEGLDSLLDIRYNLNRTEAEHEFTIFGVINQLAILQPNGIQAALSYFDQNSRTLYIHTGRKDVVVLRPNEPHSIMTDGIRGIVFPWDVHAPFNPYPNAGQPLLDWGKYLFGDMHNVTDITPSQAVLLLKVWFIFILFREAAQAKPILALFGQPGSSKTTIGHRVHTMLYGTYASLLGVTNQNNFDQSTATKPLVMLDNVDTWEPWLPDRLAQAAASTDIDKRKLYSDADTVRMRRQAMVALTAHNPKFSREDITDRLLLINMLRLDKFEPEGPIIDAVRTNRNSLWQSVIADAQKVINNPLPATTTIRFRIADFARIGEWIADGLGQREEFQILMARLATSQVTHNLQTDQVLVGAMIKYAGNGGTKGNYKNQQELFTILQMQCSSSDVATFGKIYKNQMILGKKLWTMLESLRSLMHLEFAEGNAGSRLWKIGPLEVSNG